MILLYTGANVPDAIQIDSEKSLGGFVSSTQIPNNRLANLFGGISKSVILKQKTEIKMIALKNTTGAVVTGVNIYTNNKNKSFTLQIAGVSSSVNTAGEVMFEQVGDNSSYPYQATLSSHEGIGNLLSVGSLAIGQTIGIWILRTLDITKYPELIIQAGQSSPLKGAALITAIQSQDASVEENIDLIISWN